MKELEEPAARRRLSEHQAIADEIPRRLSHLEDAYFGISSLFLQPEAVEHAWLWIRDWRNNISGVTHQWSQSNQPYRIHRMVLAKHPMLIDNIFVRQQWQIIFKTFCHLHMRDGAILYVLFLREKDGNLEELRHWLNLSFFLSGRLYPLYGFWKSDFQRHAPVEGPEARLQVREQLSRLPKPAFRQVIRMWYDRFSFEERRRPSDTLQKAFRKFTFELYNGECQAPRGNPQCMGKVNLDHGQMDHMLPISRSSNVLLNMTWLCQHCNRSKGKLDTIALPIESAASIIPNEWGTREILEGICLTAPRWIDCAGARKPENVFVRLRQMGILP